MAWIDDIDLLNNAATAGNWTASGFDTPTLNDSASTTPIYLEGSACMWWPLKKGTTNGYVYTSTIGGTPTLTGRVVVGFLNYPFADISNIPISSMFMRLSSATTFTTNYLQWDASAQVLSPENIPVSGHTPIIGYEDAGTETGTFNGNCESVGWVATTGNNADGKQGGFDWFLVVSWVGAHSATYTQTYFSGLYDEYYDNEGAGLPGQTSRPVGVLSKSGDFYQTNISFQLGDGTADTANVVVTETAKTVFFNNLHVNHELGYIFVNPASTNTISLTLTDCAHLWNDQAAANDIFTGVTNVDVFKLSGCSFARGGSVELPAHDSDTTTFVENCKFDSCGAVDIGDITFTGNTVSGAAVGVEYVGSGTRRSSGNAYNNNTVALYFDTAQTVSIDGDTFSGNTYDIENASGATGGVEGLVDSYSETNQSLYISLHNTNHGLAQSFTGDGNNLSKVEFYLRKVNSPTGNAFAKLYAHSGTFGTSSLPTGSALATSAALDVSTLTTTFALTTLTFSTAYTLANGTNYCIALEYTSGDATNTVRWGDDNSAPTHAGNSSVADTGFTWTTRARDFCFYVYARTPVVGSGALTADSYVEANQNATTALDGSPTAVGQSMTGNGGVLSNVRWYLSKTLSPTGNAVCKLYAHSGTFGTSSVPTGIALATSANVDVSALTGTLTLTQFEFEDQYTLVDGTNYVLSLEYTGTGTDYVNVGTDTTTPTHGGNFSTLVGTWSAVAGTDAIFYVSTGGILIVNATNGANPGTKVNTSAIPGAVIIQNAVTVSVKTITSASVNIQDVRVRIVDSGDNEIINGLTDSNGEISAAYNYAGDESITGWCRKATTSPLYKQGDVTGTITSSGFSVTVTMILDE